MSVEFGCIDSLYASGIVRICGESQGGSLDCHLEVLLPCADSREVRQFVQRKILFLDDTVHLMKDVK
ncbi:hypothetical protein C462_00312 [Halorubrum distributum JCM 13916]|uniref:Uncharacterized protein n=1 Tax=Halorubrum distributum JCM 13916 TaxID=1230455 RepID=M0PSX2_9EURY|nr:hypothetical protein C462_00312 [Halorubrum arcis JCM 13916]